jgi:hypothetical protein
MDDNKLRAVIADVDTLITDLILKHQIDALLMSSCVIARLCLLNKEIDGGSDFNQLLTSILETTQESHGDSILH